MGTGGGGKANSHRPDPVRGSAIRAEPLPVHDPAVANALPRGLSQLRAALLDRRLIERKIEVLLKAVYPPGAAIRWLKGLYAQDGTVVQNFYGNRLRVRNSRTGAELDIYAFDILAPGEVERPAW